MTASVRNLDLRQRNEMARLVIRELVRARRVPVGSEPPDPVNCLVTRAQVMNRANVRMLTHAVGLLEEARVTVQDAVVTHEVSLTLALARDIPSLMDLEDLDLNAIIAERFNELRLATRTRLASIVVASKQCAIGSIAKMGLVSEHQDLRQAAFAYESAYTLLGRAVRMHLSFDVLCSMESKRR
ncbi:MAG: hypothetical protein ACAI38_06015 [Myxococcota bacterium]|nr:hypothetical protein [Myxococcota bacterium]